MGETTAESQREEAPSAPGRNPVRLQPWACGAALQNYAYLALLLATFKPTLYTMPLSQHLSATLCVSSLCIGALLVLLAGRLSFSRATLRRNATTALSLLAGGALTVGALAPALASAAYATALGCTGLGLTALLWNWGDRLGGRPKEELLLNSCVGFLAVVLLLMVTAFFPQAQTALIAVALLAGCALDRRPAVSAPENAEAADCAEEPDDEGQLATLKRVILSVPCLGMLLYLFTLGITAGKASTDVRSLVSLGAAAVAMVLVLAALFRLRRRFSPNQILFGLLDIGLPGLAVVAFLIKMVPIDAVSLTLFPHYMEAYFLLLLAAFWMNLLLFASANRPLVPLACGAMGLAAAVALGVGYAITFLSSDARSVLMGSVTAAFLIYAVIAGGHSLILYLKGPESTEEAAPAAAMLDVCEKLGEEHQLTPREREVLGEVAYGHSSSYIAQTLYISNNTARSHLKNIYRKLGVHSREELIERLREAQTAMAEEGRD